MNGFTFNKIAGALLGTLLFGFFVVEVSHWLYPNPRGEHLEARGYEVAGMDYADERDAGGETVEVETSLDLGALLAGADIEAGAVRFRACGGCHTAEAGAGARVGPNLWNVAGRAIGSVEGFTYSGAMASFGGTWTLENLFGFLQGPSDFISGTSMGFAGVRRDQDRANLVAYLNTLNDHPLALPASHSSVEEVEAAEEHAAAAVHEEASNAATEVASAEVEAADDATGEAMESSTVATATHAVEPSGADGEAVFNTTCVACHGPDGSGAFGGVPDFTRADGRLAKTDDELFDSVRNGFSSPDSFMPMPARGGNPDLTDQEIRAVISYLRDAFGSN